MMQRAALLVRVLAAGSMFLPLVLSSPEADGQLSAERLYNGINRPIAMTVARPPGETEELSIRLLEPVTAQTLHTAPVKEGPINLASTFPHLWQETTPRLVYAQLFAGEHPVGPAVVMQPMEGPRVAQLRPAEARIEWVPQRARAFTGYRCYVDRVAVVQTTAGPIEFIMRPEVAPNTVFNFLHLAENGFYTDILIHRIVPRRADGAPFVIQFGDPTGTGVGTPGYHIDLERSTLQHTYGVLSMARSEDPNTNGSQVFICLRDRKSTRLNSSH